MIYLNMKTISKFSTEHNDSLSLFTKKEDFLEIQEFLDGYKSQISNIRQGDWMVIISASSSFFLSEEDFLEIQEFLDDY